MRRAGYEWPILRPGVRLKRRPAVAVLVPGADFRLLDDSVDGLRRLGGGVLSKRKDWNRRREEAEAECETFNEPLLGR